MAAGIAIPDTINKALTTGSFTIFPPCKCDSGEEEHPPRYDASREQQHGKTLGADELTDHCCSKTTFASCRNVSAIKVRCARVKRNIVVAARWKSTPHAFAPILRFPVLFHQRSPVDGRTCLRASFARGIYLRAQHSHRDLLTGGRAARPAQDRRRGVLGLLEIAFDAAGDLYIAERDNHVIRKVNMKTGIISTVAGRASPTVRVTSSTWPTPTATRSAKSISRPALSPRSSERERSATAPRPTRFTTS
jgi:hypothetical protein